MTNGALENASIFSIDDKSKSLNFLARGMYILLVRHIVRLIFQNQWCDCLECHLIHVNN